MKQTKIILLLLIICLFETFAATDFEIGREHSLEIKQRFLDFDSRSVGYAYQMIYGQVYLGGGQTLLGYFNYCGSRNCKMVPKSKQDNQNFKFIVRDHPTMSKPERRLVQIATIDNMCLTTKVNAGEDDQPYFIDCYEPSNPLSKTHIQYITLEEYPNMRTRFNVAFRFNMNNNNLYLQLDNDNIFELEPVRSLTEKDGLGAFFLNYTN